MRIVNSDRLYWFLIFTASIGVLNPSRLILAAHFGDQTRLWFSPLFLNAVVLVCSLVFRRGLRTWFDRLTAWLSLPEQVYGRKVIFSCGLFVSVSALLHFHAGFWYPGIAGWTYQTSRSQLVDVPASEKESKSTLPDFLIRAVLRENAIYLPTGKQLTSDALFLHFSDGSVRPFNYGLLGGIVFPEYVFDGLRLNRKSIVRTILTGLEYREKGKQFFLPESISYPTHSVYMPISYEGYPPPSSLKKISRWEITVAIDKNHEPRIREARIIEEIQL